MAAAVSNNWTALTEISDEDAEKIETVGAAVDYIMENNQA